MAASCLAQVLPGGGTGPASVVTGQIQTATGGGVVGGTLTFTLSQPAIVSGTATVATQTVSCYTSAQGNVVGLPDPVAIPVVTANTVSGTLPAGTYYVEIYYINAASAVSRVSPEVPVILASQGTVIVAAPAFQPSTATGYGVAIATASGSEVIQGTVIGFSQYQQATPLIIQPQGSLPQATNNSSCNVYFSDVLVPTGTYYTVNLVNTNGSQIAGFPQSWCLYGGATGTINVSQGAPTGNCNVNGVFYPTPIFANGLTQSINSPLTFASNTTFLSSSTFSGSLTITGATVATGLATFSGGLLCKSFEGVQCVDSTLSRGGVDIGDEINRAYAACPASGCYIKVAPASYSFTTPIVFGTNTKPGVIDCSAGTQGIFLPPGTGTTTLTFSPTTGTAVNFNGGGVGSGMRGCTLEGSGSGNATVGLALSNSSGGNATENLYESIDVSNFGTGLQFGQNTYLNHFINLFDHDNGTNLSVPSTSSQAQENTSFYGGSFYTKTTPYSTTCVNVLANWDANFYGVSFDQCGITLNATGVRWQMHGGHIENPNGTGTTSQFITIGSSCTQCFTDLFGVTTQEDGNGTGRTSFFSNGANGSHLLIQGGYEVIGSESTVAAMVATVAGSTTTFTDTSTNGTFTALTSGAGAFSAQTGSQFQTNVSPIIFTNTTIGFGAGAPSGSCVGNTGIYLNSSAASASTVLYVCQGGTWTAVTVP